MGVECLDWEGKQTFAQIPRFPRFARNRPGRKNLLSINELKEAFFSLKTNKSPGYDDINFSFVKKCFGEINKLLKLLFNLSLENVIFPKK